MKENGTVKINFCGGITTPGELYNILVAAGRAGVHDVRFGLRQQLLIDVSPQNISILADELQKLDVIYESGTNTFPNIISSYAAEEIFIHNTWLSEGVYKDIFNEIDYRPRLKINISDSNQSFTPILTGNINWLASSTARHFWHLFVRFPKTNIIYEWDQLVYTNDVAKLSRKIEEVIFHYKEEFYDNTSANGDLLFEKIPVENFITQRAVKAAILPRFNLPYYEGLNRYNNKYWLGIYRRDELFDIDFLKELCLLCLATKIGQICSTPWKSVIIKGIEEKDKVAWNGLLEKHTINMRHAANELNFQVEDDCSDGLQLKNFLVRGLNNEDMRTFGLSIGIKTRKKSEVFGSILIRRKALLSIYGIELFYLYDILCAHDFNPNERTGFVFSSNNPKFVLREQLRSAVIAFYTSRNVKNDIKEKKITPSNEEKKRTVTEYVYQCRHCLTVYDNPIGEPEQGKSLNTSFELIPEDYTCSLCEAPKSDFISIEKSKLGFHMASHS